MFRKILMGGSIAALAAVGAASASSLGIGDAGGDPVLAVEVVGLEACTATDIEMDSQIVASKGVANPVAVFVDQVTIFGLSEECVGHDIGIQLIRDDKGQDKQMGFFDGGVVSAAGNLTLDLYPAVQRNAEDVTKIVVVVEDRQ